MISLSILLLQLQWNTVLVISNINTKEHACLTEYRLYFPRLKFGGPFSVQFARFD